MKDLLFVVSLALIAFGLMNSLLSLGVVLAARWLRFDCPPRARARRYLLVRSFPAAGSLLFVGAFFLPVLCRYEPGNADEQLGLAMCVLATAVILILVTAMFRGIRSLRATGRLSRSWESAACHFELKQFPVPALVIETVFPVVAIAGIIRPRLYVARKVLANCSEDELDAILVHERAHLRNGDNLLRLLPKFFPDLLVWSSVATRLERGWAQACEEVADDEAVADGKGLALASALCKVARLASGHLPVAAVGIHGDGDVAHRLDRLLRPQQVASLELRGRFDSLGFAILLALPLIVAAMELPSLHAGTEAMVRLLN
jgi:hypothetical protein